VPASESKLSAALHTGTVPSPRLEEKRQFCQTGTGDKRSISLKFSMSFPWTTEYCVRLMKITDESTLSKAAERQKDCRSVVLRQLCGLYGFELPRQVAHQPRSCKRRASTSLLNRVLITSNLR